MLEDVAQAQSLKGAAQVDTKITFIESPEKDPELTSKTINQQ